MEHDAEQAWWDGVASALREVQSQLVPHSDVAGPRADRVRALRGAGRRGRQTAAPAILYGVDTRATEQVARLEAEIGPERVLADLRDAVDEPIGRAQAATGLRSTSRRCIAKTDTCCPPTALPLSA